MEEEVAHVAAHPVFQPEPQHHAGVVAEIGRSPPALRGAEGGIAVPRVARLVRAVEQHLRVERGRDEEVEGDAALGGHATGIERLESHRARQLHEAQLEAVDLGRGPAHRHRAEAGERVAAEIAAAESFREWPNRKVSLTTWPAGTTPSCRR
jgi:hypothetical protein